MREKLFAVTAEEVLLISILIIEKFWHPWRITSWKMLFLMCIFFGVSVIIAKEVELFVSRTMFKGVVVVSEKVTWILFRVLCIVLFFLIFCGFAGYVITLCLGGNPNVIRYCGLSAILHFWTGYLFDSMLGIRPKSPFDIEFERELGENGISLSIRERQDGRMGLPKEADGSILERGTEGVRGDGKNACSPRP